MKGVFQNTLVLFLLVFFSLKAGFFPVTPGDLVFPFSGHNSIYPDYPPLCDIIPASPYTGARFTFFNNESFRQGAGHCETSDWQTAVMPKAASPIFASLNKILASTTAILLSLQTYRIIFPFHAFW